MTHSILDLLRNAVVHYGYWAVGVALLLENAGVPVPGETILLLASFLAFSEHELQLPWIILVATIAATIGVPLASPAVALVQAQYPGGSFPTYDQAVGALGTDAIFACPARFADELASQFVPTFAYEFNDENAPQNFLPAVSFPYGASHASEIQYIFPAANPPGFGLNLPQTPLNGNQRLLSDKMVGYWTEFAKSGDPNGNGSPQWPQFERGRQVMQSLVPPTPQPVLQLPTPGMFGP